jgi:hypothetical protein
MKLVLVTFVLVLLAFSLGAQKIDNTVSFRDIKSERYFRFSYDNDFFTATDQNYTQGYNFEWVSPFFRKNPINRIFLKPDSFKKKYGLSWEHIGFTPGKIGLPEIQKDDRPFASALMFKSFLIATQPNKKSRFTSALNLGMLGPAAFGKEMQTEIHKVTGNIIPRGWRNQIQNQVVINYEVGFEKQLLSYRNIFLLQSNSYARLGSLFTDASVGGNFMLGLFSSPFSKENKKRFQLYLYGQALLKAIGHDATLQGNILGKKRSPHFIATDKIARLRGQANYGLVMKVGGMYFEYSQAFQSKEFEGANFYRWGGLKLGFVF